MDDGHASYETVGTLWLAFYLGITLDNPRGFNPPQLKSCGGLLGFVPRLPRSHDLADWNSRTQTGRTLGKDAFDSALGRNGVSHLAGEFHQDVDPLAQR